jgi:hypothetical protein
MTSRRNLAALLSNLLLASSAAVTFAVMAAGEQAPPLWPDTSLITQEEQAKARAAHPVNLPTWTPEIAAAYPSCVEKLPEGQIPTDVVVVRGNADVERMPFAAAWEIRTTLWIVGSCA